MLIVQAPIYSSINGLLNLVNDYNETVEAPESPIQPEYTKPPLVSDSSSVRNPKALRIVREVLSNNLYSLPKSRPGYDPLAPIDIDGFKERQEEVIELLLLRCKDQPSDYFAITKEIPLMSLIESGIKLEKLQSIVYKLVGFAVLEAHYLPFQELVFLVTVMTSTEYSMSTRVNVARFFAETTAKLDATNLKHMRDLGLQHAVQEFQASEEGLVEYLKLRMRILENLLSLEENIKTFLDGSILTQYLVAVEDPNYQESILNIFHVRLSTLDESNSLFSASSCPHISQQRRIRTISLFSLTISFILRKACRSSKPCSRSCMMCFPTLFRLARLSCAKRTCLL